MRHGLAEHGHLDAIWAVDFDGSVGSHGFVEEVKSDFWGPFGNIDDENASSRRERVPRVCEAIVAYILERLEVLQV